MADFEYDDRQLQQLFVELEPRRRKQALKGAFRKEANRVRKTAINNLRSSGIRTSRDLEKGIRAVVFKKTAGFRVTIGTKKANKAGKGERGYHLNRQGLKKPILIWAEKGTDSRYTKDGSRKRAARKRSAHYTGRMQRYGFMEQTLDDVRDSVTDDLHREVVNNVERISKKYGCK